MTLQEMLRTVWFGKWLVLVSLVAAVAGAWFYVSGQEPQYAAEATVQIVDAETLAAAGVRIESDPSLVTSDDVAAAAAEELGAGVTADALAGGTSAQYVADNPNNVVVDVTGTDPEATVAAANAMASAYVAALQGQFDDDLTGIKQRLDALAATIDEQQKAITSARAASAAASGTSGNDPVDGLLEAQYSASMEQYQTLAAQQAQATVLANPAGVLQNAVSAQLVSLPVSLVYAIAVLAGLLVGIALAVLRRGLDTRVRTAGAARRAASAPVLARLSGTTDALKTWESESVLPVATREATAYTRSVRELRTALQAAVENESGSAVIVVTSADLETPRSFVAANLAASWALSGRSVVVLSGDLRQPRLNALLPVSEEGTVSEAVAAAGAEATATPHLAVHPALRTELDPADFLASDQVRSLISRLRAAADVVIIDAPPMLVAADATILGGHADGVLLAATIGHTRIGSVEESSDRLRAANARLLGLSLDGAAGREIGYEASYAFAGAESADTDPARDPDSTSEDAGDAESAAPADRVATTAESTASATTAGQSQRAQDVKHAGHAKPESDDSEDEEPSSEAEETTESAEPVPAGPRGGRGRPASYFAARS
ncbi:Wzz/FepE/Etk N-terminal domain-containing protein [Cellulomonas sp. RIT-PI-Y]|uniref:polysaccharide biosynthesis tyrosine autokinase n=1 Tax=Cellulomonas sp. RIT-PI-Y TaxID=3035297 RepID=UPI0021D7FF95|nr:Wzz/FepE/Etk N-terminal domain-containing protein [Cellulomonas sp. RIT-PI-Y]